ncbi:MAG TPA: hypothetical protein VFQ85_07475 [Mycobacteriales bacterium]|jgi:hypothetical protein|nr:hypothetical protein [Mycobacteriales bacterium]
MRTATIASTCLIPPCLTELGSADLARVTDDDFAALRAAAQRACMQLRDDLGFALPSDIADDLSQDAVLHFAHSLRAAQQWTAKGTDGDGLVVAWDYERPSAEPVFITRQTLHAWAVWRAALAPQSAREDEPDLEFVADLDRFDISQLAAA